MDAELEGVPATDELRERLIAELAVSRFGNHVDFYREENSTPWRSLLKEVDNILLPLVSAVVAEARTEGAIAELEAAADLILAPSEHLRDSATCRDIAYDLHERAAALRGVGNQKVERWSANRLEEVLREGLPDQNAEPEWEYRCRIGDGYPWVPVTNGLDHKAEPNPCPGEMQRRVKAGPWLPADQKGTEQ